MKFNRFIWNLYISSEQGKKALEQYSYLKADYIEKDLRVIDFEFFEEVADQYPVKNFPIEIPQLIQNEIAAIGANANRGEESAKMILESKFQLSARKEFIDAFYQAKSYALRLQSKIMALAAKEGIWIFQSDKGNFQIQQAVYKSWGELNHPDAFHLALKTIGKNVVCK